MQNNLGIETSGEQESLIWCPVNNKLMNTRFVEFINKNPWCALGPIRISFHEWGNGEGGILRILQKDCSLKEFEITWEELETLQFALKQILKN